MQKIITLVLVLSAGVAMAQNEGTLTFMNSLPQVMNNNPAFIPKYKLTIGLPISSVAVFYSNNGFAYKDVYSRIDDTVKADLPKLNRSLKSKNYITQAVQLDLLRIGVKINSRLYMTLNSTAKVYNRMMIPKELLGIIANGNSSYVGQTIHFSPKVESVTYLETALGAAYRIDDRLTVGGRLKLLKGITNVTTQSASMNLTVGNDYTLTANAGMDVRTSGTNNFTKDDFDFGSHLKDYFSNNGFAVDLGATYKLDDRITLGASLIDIGKIRWKNNTYGYTLAPATANYTFAGIDLNKVVDGNSDYISSIGDTINSRFKAKEKPIGSYSTTIPGKMYLSGMYEVKKNFSAGAVFFTERFRDRTTAGLTLGVNKNFGRFFTASGSYTMASNSYNNLGMGMSLNLSPVQIYFVGDNLLRMPFGMNSFINNTKFFNLRFGLNFVFGHEAKEKRGTTKKGPDDDSGMRRKMYRNYTPKKN